MKDIFNKNNLKILKTLSFTPTLYAFDFDGTLSKIVRNPREAAIKASTNNLLKQLSNYAPIAIITGRSIADLKTHLKFIPPYLIGNHGIESFQTSRDKLNSANKICNSWELQLNKNVHFDLKSIQVENKYYSLTIHLHKCDKKIKKSLLKILSNLKPKPSIIFGKNVVNVLTPWGPRKGDALTSLMYQTRIQSAFYIGDDETDEAVFSLSSSQILTVRVGKIKNSKSQFYIKNQSDMDRLLKTIIKFYQKT